MPRYHFNSVDGQVDRDADGMVLPDVRAARLEAVRYAGELLRDDPDRLWQSGQWSIDVTNDAGERVFAIETHVVEGAQSKPTGRDS